MPDAVSSSLGIVAYLALFSTVAIIFLLVNLLVGRLVRPQNPIPEKLEIYECGEPAVGSSYVQFDLRFYVVALLFIIFDVEVAFFFPWATVFGKATHLAALGKSGQAVAMVDGSPELTASSIDLYRELGVRNPSVPKEVPASLRQTLEIKNSLLKDPAGRAPDQKSADIIVAGARQLAWVTLADIAVFFAVLLVGFAYVWNRGDLNWVRAFGSPTNNRSPGGTEPVSMDLDQALSA
jgi:NADH-quinone oxidoreductase subunit A